MYWVNTVFLRKSTAMRYLFVFICVIALSFSTNASLSSRDSISVAELSNNIAELQEELQKEKDQNSGTLSRVSALIDASSHNLSIFSYMVAIVGISISVYISVVFSKVRKTREECDQLKNDTLLLRSESENIKKQLELRTHEIYERIKKEEIENLLIGLENNPTDIQHCYNLLAIRNLSDNYFEYLKSAYYKLGDIGNIEETLLYMKLFFRFFLGQSMKNPITRQGILPYYKTCIFETDITTVNLSTLKFVSAAVDLGLDSCKEDINALIEGLSFKIRDRGVSNENLLNIISNIYNQLYNKENKFLFYKIIDSNNLTNRSKKIFLSLIKEEFDYVKLSNSEKLIIEADLVDVDVKSKQHYIKARLTTPLG